jgi:hypothetical protein
VAASEHVSPDAAQRIARWFYALRARNAEVEAAVADILSTAADRSGGSGSLTSSGSPPPVCLAVEGREPHLGGNLDTSGQVREVENERAF